MVVAAGLLLAHRRLLDVLRVGEVEAASLGVDVGWLRLTVVAAATLGAASAVAVSGLIGFVGIIVPHTVRLTAGASYRVVLPVSMIGGAAFLVLADIAARTVQSPAEVPIGVITALVGAPFFLFVLRSRRASQDLVVIGIDGCGSATAQALALAGVSEQVAAGEWLAVIGPNGAGKSTLLRCVASLARHDGQVTVGRPPGRRAVAAGSWPGWSPTSRSHPSAAAGDDRR